MPSAELAEWMAFDLIEPFGGGRDDDRARLVATMVHAVNRDRGDAPLDPAALLPAWRPAELVDDDERTRRLAAWLEAHAE